MKNKELDDDQKDEIVEIEEPDNEVEETEDGGAIIRDLSDDDQSESLAHFANIIDEVDQSSLNSYISDLIEKIGNDKEAREKRDKQYEEGLRRTGLGDDAPGGAQFTGANKVVHPMLIEACVDFSARVMKEIFPTGGPVKSKVIGEQTKAKLEKSRRKVDFMNWQTTKQMIEFRGELEQLSTQLPLGGGQYMKFMWSPLHKRPVSEFIPIDDIYLPFAATNFYTAERKTHVQYITKFEYQRRVQSGMYRDVDLVYPDDPEFSKSAIANEKIEGKQDLSYNLDGLRTIFEVYTYLDFGDGLEPYILTIDKSTNQGLSLYRNWEQDDNLKQALDWIVEFPFVPWRGAYPIGLTHMIGGLSGAATGALRALLDSAHIQNVPTLLKLKGGPGGQTLNIQPTEVVELEGDALVDDVRKLAMPLPFNGPSPTLFQLLGFLVDAGKGVVQTTFEKLSDQNANQPVGTTMALIEQGMVVFSAIHSRLHSAMSRCLDIIHRIDSAYLTEEDIEAHISGIEIDISDFDGPTDVIPVTDPAIFSETQRFAQTQAILQRAAALPQLYDQRKVEEMFLRNLKVPEDDVLQTLPGSEDIDPVSENVAASMGRPIYALPKQDHLAHIKVHLAFLQSPMFGKNPAIIKTYLYPMATHLRDHLLNYYLSEAHNAVDQAQSQNLIQEEANEQVQLILKVQSIIEQSLSGFDQVLAQTDKEAQQFAPQNPMPQDNSLQIAQMNAQLQAQSLQQRNQIEQAKLQQAAQFKQADQSSKQQDDNNSIRLEQMKQQQENARKQLEVDARVKMNTDDNNTALNIAAAEINTGERIAVHTGTGINP
jgi:hypothetical protein